ncbi:Mini-ribonuclease 3 [Anaerotignum sp.]|uniref:Mini-ribonuclease 3 n=1 Tax=Anaerotignum sp. TaxID=2039241 RepID=UPI00271540CE|nr:ribonuclease III domain-containing protein [Anaerotignum sp.]
MDLKELDLILGNNGEIDPKGISPLVLAYIGDAVYEMFVRLTVLTDGNAPVNRLHKKARDLVNAKAQAEMYFRFAKELTEEEAAVFRRGRNAKSFTTPKNADLMDYRHATGLEALFGYLYLKGEKQRAINLFSFGMVDIIKK